MIVGLSTVRSIIKHDELYYNSNQTRNNKHLLFNRRYSNIVRISPGIVSRRQEAAGGHGEASLQLLNSQLVVLLQHAVTGIVHQRLDRSVLLFHLLHHDLHPLLVGDVRLQGHHPLTTLSLQSRELDMVRITVNSDGL